MKDLILTLNQLNMEFTRKVIRGVEYTTIGRLQISVKDFGGMSLEELTARLSPQVSERIIEGLYKDLNPKRKATKKKSEPVAEETISESED